MLFSLYYLFLLYIVEIVSLPEYLLSVINRFNAFRFLYKLFKLSWINRVTYCTEFTVLVSFDARTSTSDKLNFSNIKLSNNTIAGTWVELLCINGVSLISVKLSVFATSPVMFDGDKLDCDEQLVINSVPANNNTIERVQCMFLFLFVYPWVTAVLFQM